MVNNLILCLSLLCAAPVRGDAMQPVETKTVLDECRDCLMKKGREWDERAWAYSYEWDGCMENRLFKRLPSDQKLVIKNYLGGLGYYWFEAKSQTYLGAKKRIRTQDIDGILDVIERVIREREPVAGSVAPLPRPIVQVGEPKAINKELPEDRVAAAPVTPTSAQGTAPRTVNKDLPENLVVTAPVTRPSVQKAEGRKMGMELSGDRVVVGSGAVFVPSGVFLLVRKGNSYGAIRFTEIKLGEKGGVGSAVYESYFQGDASGSFTSINVLKRGGRLSFKRGAPRLRVGEWAFEYAEPGCVKMFPHAAGPGDYGYEFAPIAIRDVAKIDVRDKRIQWYKYDINSWVEILLKDLPQ